MLSLCACVCLPISRGDSFLPLVLCGEAPCSSSILTFAIRPASTARVRAVSPSSVGSSRVRSADVIAADKKNTSIRSMLRLVIHICRSTVSLHSDSTPSLLNPHPAAPHAGHPAAAARLMRAEPTSPCRPSLWRLAGSPTAPAAHTRHLGRHNPTLVVHSRQLGYPCAKPWVKFDPYPFEWLPLSSGSPHCLLLSYWNKVSLTWSINQFYSIDGGKQTVLELVTCRWFNSGPPFLLLNDCTTSLYKSEDTLDSCHTCLFVPTPAACRHPECSLEW